MILRPAPVSTKQFIYEHTTRTFSAEISSTNGFGRVYDDAVDEGFTMVSEKSGKGIVFVVSDEEIVDGDIRWWTLKSLEGNFTAIIWND